MDIHKWLSETVLPRLPPSPPGQGEEHHVPSLEKSKRFSNEQYKRKPSSSDSSLLDDPPQRKKGPPSGRVPSIEEEPDENGNTDASRSTSRSERSMSSKSYRRRPRRKTRSERYEPLSKDAKERGLHAQRRDKGESKKERRKTRRRKANRSGSGIVQSFQAKNVPRDRLTLKPREKLGLFNKGRVSSPVKGRGLPDLVFSEMRFLQKHNDKAEVNPPPGSPRKKRKKDNAHVNENEISAYFTSVRPALAKQDLDVQTKKRSHRKLRDVNCSLQQPPSVDDQAIPTVEPADQTSHLGFGDRGPRHESGSSISWSESIRIPSLTPAHCRLEVTKSSGQLGSTRSDKIGNTVGGEVLHSPPNPPITTRHVMDNVGGQFQVSSLPPKNECLSRSHSLPQHTSSPRRINMVDRAARRRTMEDVASPSTMPSFVSTHRDHRRHIYRSDILESRGHVQFVQPTIHRDVRLDSDTEPPAHEDLGQHASSSLGRILQECNTAFHQQRTAEALQPNDQDSYQRAPGQSNMRQATEAYPTVRRIPNVRFAGVEVYYPAVPTIAGPSIYEQQEEELYGHTNQLFCEEGTLPPPQDMQDEYFDEVAFDSAEQDWDDEAELADDGVGLDPLINEMDRRQMNDNIADSIQSRGSIVAQPGFWRPHKLY